MPGSAASAVWKDPAITIAREHLHTAVPGGELATWVTGEGPPLLLLHGGPGLGYEYLDTMLGECDGFHVAGFQQRGLAPSTLAGPFTIAQALDDVTAVLDELGWERAIVAGHSWGGHLALRFAAAHPERLLGLLAIEPLGVVGDGGRGAFSEELAARMPADDAEALERIEREVGAGDWDEAATVRGLELLWPGYFGDPTAAPPMPTTRFSPDANDALSAEMTLGLEPVADALGECPVPAVVLAGTGSPIPWGQAANLTAQLFPRGALSLVGGAGHFLWLERPGCVRAALAQLRAELV